MEPAVWSTDKEFRQPAGSDMSASRQVERQCLVGGVFVHVPAGDDAGAYHLVAEAGEAVGGVGVEGELEELVCFAASAFPPVDVADTGKDRCCVFSAGEGVGVQEQLLGPFDA